METTLLQVTVKEWPDLLDPVGYKLSFAVRVPHEVYLQEVTVSTLEYEELLNRCWEVIRDRILEHYEGKETAKDR